MQDVIMAEILKLNVTNLVFPADTNFSYVSPIPDVVLDKVPSSNPIITIYKKIPNIGSRHVLADLQEIFDVNVVTRRTGAGGKRKAKIVEEVVVPKPKKQKNINMKAKPLIVYEEEDQTIIIYIRVEIDNHCEDDTAKSSKKLKTTEIPTLTKNMKVSKVT
ncbi:unnamed protein product [Lactuca virosa]|uniref:Uncharacterized protein n=1 Tax=Lactuca virosa TaxID=75947 RepID=A0AAU9PE57_9ASTR|nr:unnamed protein product [Lactuca virosa]